MIGHQRGRHLQAGGQPPARGPGGGRLDAGQGAVRERRDRRAAAAVLRELRQHPREPCSRGPRRGAPLPGAHGGALPHGPRERRRLPARRHLLPGGQGDLRGCGGARAGRRPVRGLRVRGGAGIGGVPVLPATAAGPGPGPLSGRGLRERARGRGRVGNGDAAQGPGGGTRAPVQPGAHRRGARAEPAWRAARTWPRSWPPASSGIPRAGSP